MNDFISELIAFIVVAIVVVLLAFLTKKVEDKYNDDEFT